MKKCTIFEFGIIIAGSILLAIWSLPGTIALRNILLSIGLLASIIYLSHNRSSLFSMRAWNIWILFAFFPWVAIHLALFSTQFNLQLHELESIWVRSFAALILGFAIGLISSNEKHLHFEFFDNPCRPALIFLGLGGTSIICMFFYTKNILFADGIFNYGILFSLYKAKTPFIVAAALFTPACVTILIFCINSQITKWWLLPALTGLIATLFSVIFSDTKNGVLVFTACLLLAPLIIFINIKNWSRTSALQMLIVAITITLVTYIGLIEHLSHNSAWRSMGSNIKVAIDIDHQNFWKNRENFKMPKNEFNDPVDLSTYERVAWFTAGVRLLRENPQGFGLVHHSFGWLASAKWPEFYKPIGNLRGATHSGWMDIALGVGLPGIALIWIPLLGAWIRSLLLRTFWGTYAQLAIPIVMLAYFVSEASYAHFVEILFFITAFFCSTTRRSPSEAVKTS